MREISNLDLKIQLTNEYLRTGGMDQIFDVDLLQDLIDAKFDMQGKAIPDSITPRLNAFMLAILASHLQPPLHSDNHIAEYSSFVQKSLFFDQIQINTKGEIDDLIKKHEASKNIIFRGQREAKWRLYSSLQRFWVWDKLEEAVVDYTKFLSQIVDSGKNEFNSNIKEILKEINIDSLNDIAVLGFLQHHGCPTPMLDWTYNFNTALFFGIDNIEQSDSPREIDQYFSIYFVNEEHFNSGGMRNMLNEGLQKIGEQLKLGLIAQIAKDEEQRKEMEEHFHKRSFFAKERIKGSGLVNYVTNIERMVNIPIGYFSDKDVDSGIIFSMTNSENIKKQDGVFTWNSHFSKPIEVVGNEQYSEAKAESEPDDYRFCECYNINKDLMDYIITRLAEVNITKDTMYPDVDIEAKYVYDNIKDAIT